MNLNDDYYRSGFLEVPFVLTRLTNAIDRAEKITQDEGYSWEEKYPHSVDFRPSACQFDDVFINVLIDNDVPSLLKEATMQTDLTLIHCQLRRVYPRPQSARLNPSYMDWHRDTYLDSKTGQWIGNTPAVHKLIVYPDDDRRDSSNEERLAILSGSHRIMIEGLPPEADLGLQTTASKYLNEWSTGRIAGMAVAVIKASNTRALLFNTSLLHSVRPEVRSEGSIRIIYSFATVEQYRRKYADQQLHSKIHEMYEVRRIDA